MSTQLKPHFTPEEYLSLERRADYKNEYYQGEIFTMTGASRKHNLISFTIGGILYRQLYKQQQYEVYANDMRVKVSAFGLYTYPDISVVCNPPQFDDPNNDTLLNPKIIIEILSDSTEKYDRGDKFKMYRSLPSLTDYLLVAQKEYLIEHYIRQAEHQWLLMEYQHSEDIVWIESIQCKLPLTDIYERVDIAT